jgi:hypothetical protein
MEPWCSFSAKAEEKMTDCLRGRFVVVHRIDRSIDGLQLAADTCDDTGPSDPAFASFSSPSFMSNQE